MKKILITGNQGYVGSRIITLIRNFYPDAQIVGYDAGYFAGDVIGDQEVPEIVLDSQIYGDVRTIDKKLMSDVDGLILLAAVSNDPIGARFADVTNEINTESNKRLIDLAVACKVKSIVFASSCSMYGFSDTGAAKFEHDILNPLTAYALSKVNIEKYLEGKDLQDTTATSLRFSTACGASPRIRLDLVLNDFVYSAVRSRKIEILSDGSPWRPIIDVWDMGQAILWALSREGQRYLAVNVGFNENNFQVYQLAEMVRENIGSSVKISINKNARPDRRSYKVNFDLYAQSNPTRVRHKSISSSIGELAIQMEQVAVKEKYIRLNRIERLIAAGRLSENLEWEIS